MTHDSGDMSQVMGLALIRCAAGHTWAHEDDMLQDYERGTRV